MPITQWQADDELNLILRGVSLSLPASLALSLHSADPGFAGDQTTNELGYFGYQRQLLSRDALTWSAPVAGPPGVRVITLTNTVDWFTPTSSFSLPTAWAYVGIGDALTGAGRLRFRCPVGPFTVDVGKTPRLVAGSQLYICNC